MPRFSIFFVKGQGFVSKAEAKQMTKTYGFLGRKKISFRAFRNPQSANRYLAKVTRRK